VVLFGKAITFGEKQLNAESAVARKMKGLLLVMCLIVYCVAIGVGIEFIPHVGWILAVILTAILVAQRDLSGHVMAVAEALRIDIQAGRTSVAQIVGRDTKALNESEVSRAAIESAAENFSDGVVAPVVWFVLFGLPGVLVYKVVNTADSMIGHRTPKLKDFGWAAARLDDVMNFLPARLTALLFLTAGWAFEQREMVMSDAPAHRSWNAGWPEAAMAGVLGVALSGPRSYAGQTTSEPWLNASGRKDPGPDDIEAAAMLTWRAWMILLLALCVLTIVT
ncbi:MAG: adenosylcobinamide-phosphate synthase CbiB, partial [Deltaproteobacteria bacterium]